MPEPRRPGNRNRPQAWQQEIRTGGTPLVVVRAPNQSSRFAPVFAIRLAVASIESNDSPQSPHHPSSISYVMVPSAMQERLKDEMKRLTQHLPAAKQEAT